MASGVTIGGVLVAVVPLLLVAALLVLTIRSGLFERLGDRAIDRRLGEGQGKLFREALEHGRIPAGGDVRGWRAVLPKSERSLFSRLILPGAIFLLALIWSVVGSDSVAEWLVNIVPFFVLIGIVVLVAPHVRRGIRQRQRLREMLDETHGSSDND